MNNEKTSYVRMMNESYENNEKSRSYDSCESYESYDFYVQIAYRIHQN